MDELTKSAVKATLHCLTGCAIGEVLGMVIASALNFTVFISVVLSVVLAFAFGYGLSIRPVLKADVPFKKAVKVALAADTVSISSMEIVDNLVVVVIPGAIAAGLTSYLFWGSLTLSLIVAFIITVPVNRYLIKRGKGHAVAHQYHH